VAGRTHRAKPGEPDCPAEGCERPAGFATANPGEVPAFATEEPLRPRLAPARRFPWRAPQGRPVRRSNGAYAAPAAPLGTRSRSSGCS
jgi:hypothetical protein